MKQALEAIRGIFSKSSREKVFNFVDRDDDGVKSVSGQSTAKIAGYVRIIQTKGYVEVQYTNAVMMARAIEHGAYDTEFDVIVPFEMAFNAMSDGMKAKATRSNLTILSDGATYRIKIVDGMDIYYKFDFDAYSELAREDESSMQSVLAPRFCVGAVGQHTAKSHLDTLNSLAIYIENGKVVGSIGIAGAGYAAARLGDQKGDEVLVPKAYASIVSQFLAEGKEVTVLKGKTKTAFIQEGREIYVPQISGTYPVIGQMFDPSQFTPGFEIPRSDFVRLLKRASYSFKKVNNDSEVFVTSIDGQGWIVTSGDSGDAIVKLDVFGTMPNQSQSNFSFPLLASILSGAKGDTLRVDISVDEKNICKIARLTCGECEFLIMPRITAEIGYNDNRYMTLVKEEMERD